MLGSQILDVVIGLIFVYLVLSMIVSAINEYAAAISSRRGRCLMEGLRRLLEDVHAEDGATQVFEKLRQHPLIRTLYGKPGLLSGKERPPSYLPARTFATALLHVIGESQPAGEDKRYAATPSADLKLIIDLLKRDSAWDVTEFLDPAIAASLANQTLPEEFRKKLGGLLSGAQSDIEKLHNSVEVWFNNAMDRVSGVYKRRTQVVLFWIGLGVAVVFNADTIDLWRRLSTNDKLRDGLAALAVRSLAQSKPSVSTDSANTTTAAAPDTSAAAQAAAAEKLLEARAMLDSTQLNLGWSRADAISLGWLQHPDSARRQKIHDGQRKHKKPLTTPDYVVARSPFHWYAATFWPKLLGLLLTTFALSMGAPFWFDMLNKVVNVRAAGRAPDERAKSPEATAKRPAEKPAK